MPSHLIAVCRAGSACPTALGDPDLPATSALADARPSTTATRPPLYVPQDPAADDVSTMAVVSYAIIIGLLAIGLFLLAEQLWHSRRHPSAEDPPAPGLQSTERKERGTR